MRNFENKKQCGLNKAVAIFLAIVFAFSTLPLHNFAVKAADEISYGLADPSKLQYAKGEDKGTFDSTTMRWSMPGVRTGSANTGTLTFTNNTGYEARLIIAISSVTNGGSVSINGQTVEWNQDTPFVLQSGASVQLTHTGARQLWSPPTTVATFSKIVLVPTTRVASAKTEDEAMGTATVSNENPQRGTTVTFSAQVQPGYVFDGWSDSSGNIVHTQAEYTIAVGDSNPLELTATFSELNDVNVGVSVVHDKCGTVSVGDIAFGSTATFLFAPNSGKKTIFAEPKVGYVFYGWIDGTFSKFEEGMTVIQTGPSYEVDIKETHYYLTAVFLRNNNFSAISASEQQGTATVDRSNGVLYETVTFTASANEGYIFDGWYDTTGVLYSVNPVYSYKILQEKDVALTAHFRQAEVTSTVCALYSSTSTNATLIAEYADLQAGLNAAASDNTNKVVVLTQPLTLTYNVVVPEGVTLVIPYSETDRGSRDFQKDSDGMITTAYATSLTVPENISVTVNGTLIVNAKQGMNGTNYSGNIVGTYGLINLEGDLLVENGGVLKARGLITGASGLVRANPGSSVYQLLEMADWRGGSVSSNIFSHMFPINTFYLQNIQTDFELYEGSTLKVNYYVVLSINLGITTVRTEFGEEDGDDVILIDSSPDALFRLAEGSKLVFRYQKHDASGGIVGKSIIDIYGDVYAQYIAMDISGNAISTQNVPCPISGAFDVNVMDGATFNIVNQFRFLPGGSLTIHEGGTVSIGENGALFFYDLEDFEDDASTGFSYKGYRKLSTTSGAAKTNYKESEDGKLVVNGTLIVNGGFYSSSGIDADGSGAADNTDDDIYSSSVITTASTGKIVIGATAKLSTKSIYEYDYASATNDNGKGKVNVYFTGARGVMVDKLGQWTVFEGNKTYYSNGSAWYTYAVQYQNSNSAPVENGTYYYIGKPSTLPAGPAVGAIPTKDGMYIYGGRSWGSATSGFLTNGCEATIVQPAEATPIGLDSSLELEYRLNDYIWLNAKVYSPAAGTAKLVDANGTELADFSLVPLNNGYYYIIRKVTSTELVTPYTVYLQIDGLKTEALSVGFQAYKESIYSTADQATKDLLDAMLVYGEAAEDKFVGTNSTTATVTKPNVSGAHTDMNLDRGNVIITQDVHAYGYGVNLNFDNCIRFIYGLQLEGMTDAKWANVVQIGLIRADQTAGDLFAEGSTAYVLYHNAGLAQNSANLPDFGLATNGTDATLSLDAVKAMWNNGTGILEISYDMLYEDYNTVYTYRPYVMFKVGDELIASYGEQFDYGLETYLANRIDNPKDSKEQNLLYATWNYMKAVEAWMA